MSTGLIVALVCAVAAIVYGAVSTFGPRGSKRDSTGVDLIAQAESGLMDVTGFADGPALPVGATPR